MASGSPGAIMRVLAPFGRRRRFGVVTEETWIAVVAAPPGDELCRDGLSDARRR